MRKALFFLGTLNDSDIDWMASKGVRVKVPAGKRLIEEGEALSDIFIVVDGTFAVTAGAAGRELARLRCGEILGEISFVDSRPPSATVSATEDGLVLAVSKSQLEAKLADDLPFASRFFRALSVFLADRLRTTTAQIGKSDSSDTDELDLETLDRLSLAGARIDWLLSRLRGK